MIGFIEIDRFDYYYRISTKTILPLDNIASIDCEEDDVHVRYNLKYPIAKVSDDSCLEQVIYEEFESEGDATRRYKELLNILTSQNC